MKLDPETQQLIRGGQGHSPADLIVSLKCIGCAIALFAFIAAMLWLAGLPGAH